jgi:uncharacterized protein (DUF58 family)
MLTRNGWFAAVAAVVAGVVARSFAVVELFVVAAALGALVIVSWLWVRLATIRLRIGRSVQPARVYAGETTRVEVNAVNTGSSRTPVLTLTDPVAGTRGALLHLAPLAGGEQARAAYRLPTTQRGIVRVGPLRVEVTDPFGLARRRATGAPVLDVTVFPSIDRISVPNLGGDEDPHGNSQRHNLMGRTSDEFFAMRQYVMGDDLRRVNWKATARATDLMVRQDESPWQDRTTVLLDTRNTSYDDESFERAVSAAASIVAAAFGSRHLVRFVASDGTDSNASTGLGHSEAILEYLAGVQLHRTASLRSSLETLQRSAEGGLFVVVGGSLQSAELQLVGAMRRRFRRTIALTFHGERPIAPAGVLVADLIEPDSSFVDEWNAVAKPKPNANQKANFNRSVNAP